MNKTMSVVAAMSLGMSLLAPPAYAQQAASPVYTFVAFQDVPASQRQDFESYRQKHIRPVFDEMLSNGTLLSWGLFTTVVHKASGYTHGEWWTAADVSRSERVRGEIEKLPADVLSVRSRDYMFQVPIHRIKAGAGSGYLWVHAVQTQSGAGELWRELWEKHTKPLYEEMLAAGTLVHYEVEAEYVHTEEPGWRYVVATMGSPGAVDRANAARAAYESSHLEEARQAAADFAEVVVPGTRRDYFARIEAYAQK